MWQNLDCFACLFLPLWVEREDPSRPLPFKVWSKDQRPGGRNGRDAGFHAAPQTQRIAVGTLTREAEAEREAGPATGLGRKAPI